MIRTINPFHAVRTIAVTTFTIAVLCGSLTAQHWSPLGPTGGQVGALAVDTGSSKIFASVGNKIYVGTVGTGIWQETVLDANSIYSVNIVDIMPASDGIYAISRLGAVWYSGNSGSTWELRRSAVTSGAIQGPMVELRDTLYVIQNSGQSVHVQASTDRGASWETVDSFSFHQHQLATHEGRLYILGSEGLLHRVSKGRWENVGPNTEEPMSVAFHGDTIFLTDLRFRNLYKSTDRGSSWETLNGFPDAFGVSIDADTVWVLELDRVWRIELDNGTIATEFELEEPIGTISDWVHLRGTQIIADLRYMLEWNGSVVKESDRLWNSLSIDQIVPRGDSLMVRTKYRLHVGHIGETTWHEGRTPENNGLVQLAADGPRTYGMVFGDNLLYRSSDNGLTWTQHPFVTGKVLANVGITASQGAIWGVTGASVVRSLDSGLTRQSITIDTGISASRIFGDYEILYVPANTIDGIRLYRSVDQGETWQPTTLPSGTTSMYDMAVGDTNVYILDLQRKLHRTFDGSERWDDLTPSIADSFTRIDSFRLELNIHAFGDTVYVPAYAFGETNRFVLFISSDAGRSWNVLDAPDNQLIVTAMSYKGHLVVGTENGAYYGDFPAGVSTERVPGDNGLAPDLSVRYVGDLPIVQWSVPQPTSIRVDLYDATGRHVITPYEGPTVAGINAIEIPTDAVQSGWYMAVVRRENGRSKAVPIIVP